MIRCAKLSLAALWCAFLLACSGALPRYRTLPDWVQRVYVPIFENETAEPGLEELGARFAIEEFLIDGRLEVANKADADLIVRVNLQEFLERPVGFSNDDFGETIEMTAIGEVQLLEPSNPDPKTPFANLGSVQGRVTYYTDKRSSFVTLDSDAKEQLMRNFGRAVVVRVITGFSDKNLEQYNASAAPEGLLAPWSRRPAVSIGSDMRDY